MANNEEIYTPNSTYWCYEECVTFGNEETDTTVKRSIYVFIDGEQKAYAEDLYAYNIHSVEAKNITYQRGSYIETTVKPNTPYNVSCALVYFAVKYEA